MSRLRNRSVVAVLLLAPALAHAADKPRARALGISLDSIARKIP